MRSWLSSAVFAASFLACAAPASATPLTYSLTGGSCTSDCSAIGLSSGDAISASFTVDSSAAAIGSSVGNGDLINFTFDAGDVHVTLASAAFFQFSGAFAADGFHMFQFLATNAVFPATGDGFSLNGSLWSASGDTYLQEMAGAQAFTMQSPASGTLGVFSAIDTDVPAVPEPATLALFGFGLLGLRRRKR